jgi:RNA polymerase sigma factor (sigma-70 family)
MTEDAELLRQYVETRSEAAFTELVQRHLPLVYSAAVRQTAGDAELAKDVAQSVFIDLARKAKSLAGRELLAGWLYNATRLAASKARRGDRRRQVRELTAVAMQESTIPAPAEPDPGALRRELDEAMGELEPEDRDAVLLRFFQDKGLREVGATLGISEDAARMRVNRSLGKLHSVLLKRGVTLSAAALGTALAAEAVTAAPAGLAAAIAGTALASVPAVGGTALTLVKLLAMTKLKVGIAGAILLACVAIPVAVQQQSRNQLREEKRSLQERVDQLAADNERLTNLAARPATVASPAPLTDAQKLELLRLRGEVSRLRPLAETATARSKNTEPTRQEEPAKDPEVAEYERQFDSKAFFSRELLRALLTYTQQHQGQLPADLAQAAPFLSDKAKAVTNATIQQFEVVDPASCIVLTNASWGIMVREREPWHGFGSNWGRTYSWIQSDRSRQSSACINEGDQPGLAKWEAQAKWEMDYARQEHESAPQGTK